MRNPPRREVRLTDNLRKKCTVIYFEKYDSQLRLRDDAAAILPRYATKKQTRLHSPVYVLTFPRKPSRG